MMEADKIMVGAANKSGEQLCLATQKIRRHETQKLK